MIIPANPEIANDQKRTTWINYFDYSKTREGSGGMAAAIPIFWD